MTGMFFCGAFPRGFCFSVPETYTKTIGIIALRARAIIALFMAKTIVIEFVITRARMPYSIL